MVKKKTHIDFCHELKAQNLKVTVLGTYKDYNSKIAVKCDKCGCEWSPRAGSLLHGHGCPRCAGVKLKSHAEFVKDLKSLRDDVIITGRYVKALEKTKFRFLKCGHECDITPAHVLSGRGCPECGRSQKGASQRLTMEIFLERLHKIDPNLVVSEGAMYINNHTLMPLHCNACGYEYQIRPHDVLNQRGCPNCHRSCTSFLEQFIYDDATVPFDNCLVTHCDLVSRRNTDKLIEITKKVLSEFGLNSNLGTNEWEKIKKNAQIDSRRMSTEEFREELSKINDKIEIIGDFAGANNRIKAQCKVCNHEWHVRPSSLRLGSGCPKCAGTLKMTHNDFVERLNSLQPNIIPLAEYINIDTSIRIKCKICGYIWSTQPYHLVAKYNRTGCPKCANKARRTHDDFVEEIAKLLPTIKVIGTYVSRNKPILVQCSECGKTWQAYPGNLLRGSSCKSCKFKNTVRQRSKKTRCITTGEIFNTFKEAAEKYNISCSTICLCCNDSSKHKHAGGLEWEYTIL